MPVRTSRSKASSVRSVVIPATVASTGSRSTATRPSRATIVATCRPSGPSEKTRCRTVVATRRGKGRSRRPMVTVPSALRTSPCSTRAWTSCEAKNGWPPVRSCNTATRSTSGAWPVRAATSAASSVSSNGSRSSRMRRPAAWDRPRSSSRLRSESSLRYVAITITRARRRWRIRKRTRSAVSSSANCRSSTTSRTGRRNDIASRTRRVASITVGALGAGRTTERREQRRERGGHVRRFVADHPRALRRSASKGRWSPSPSPSIRRTVSSRSVASAPPGGRASTCRRPRYR